MIDNVQLSTIFDLLFLVLDPQDELFDRSLASHLVSLCYVARNEEEDTLSNMSTLRDCPAYALEHVHPVLTDATQQRFIQAYVDTRKVGASRGQFPFIHDPPSGKKDVGILATGSSRAVTKKRADLVAAM